MVILLVDIEQVAEKRDAGIVDPGIEAAKRIDGGLRYPVNLRVVADIHRDVDGLATGEVDFVTKFAQRILVTCYQNQTCATVGGHARRDNRAFAGQVGIDAGAIIEHADLDGGLGQGRARQQQAGG